MPRHSLAFRVSCIAVVLGATACSSTIDRSTLGATTTTSSTVAPTTTSSTTTTEAPTTTEPPTTTTEPPIVTKGGVLKVANAANVDLAASRLTNEFAAMGFDVRDATNSAGPDRELEVSKIYVVAGSEAVAFSVSRLMGGIEVYAMTTPAWIKGGTEGLADATVLIMLGKDLAKVELDDMTD
ncbi:MAG: hypothetical protein RJB65_2227 [Actinomycetota bacterium]